MVEAAIPGQINGGSPLERQRELGDWGSQLNFNTNFFWIAKIILEMDFLNLAKNQE